MDFLDRLGIEPLNPGSFAAAHGWISDSGGASITSFNPASGVPIAKVAAAGPDEYRRIVRGAREAFLAWREVPAPIRGEAVRQIADALRTHKDDLGSLVALESGKIKAEGDGEVQEMIDIADFAVGQSRMLYGKTMHSERPFHRMYEQWHPLGPVGVITAFNFPVAVWSWNAFIAAICGNSLIWKPSEKTPLCAIAVQKICNRVLERLGHPAIFSLFQPAERTQAQALVDDPQVPLVSFTGSSAVGRLVNERIARRYGRAILECSGNNAVIVDETANLDIAVPAIVFGAVGTAGQRCTTTRRLFVHRSRFKTLADRLTHAYRQVVIGDPLDSGVLMGPLIDGNAVAAFRRAIDRVRELGGEILHGGHTLEGAGHFVEPTLVVAESHWDIVQQETFAPILYLMPYDHLDEAIEANNGVAQGLSSALFSTHIQHIERFLSAMGSDCGIANINIGTSGAEIGGAFGGEKETGGGREAGSDAWKAYMRSQTNTINWGDQLPLAQGIRFDLPGDDA
ncbi:MAG: aldehyde dehydrogenase family protein [Gammaproteobacteria bacterium]